MNADKKRRPRASIRRTVALLFTITLVVAFLLITGFETVITSYYRGETNPITRIFNPSPAAARSAGTSLQVMRLFNAALLEGPGEAASEAFLLKAAELAAPLGVVMRVGDRITFSSMPLDGDRAGRLPAFGEAAPSEPYGQTPEEAVEKGERSPIGLLYQMDFRTEKGEAASFFILHGPPPERKRPPFGRQIALIVAIILLAADGAAGVFFMLRLTGPLRRVESAALAISRGGLETPVEGGYRFVELERVFEALETMRSEIRELVERERESETERRELIANLSHDLRTPLAAIRGYVDGLREGIADTPDKRERYLAVLSQKIHTLDRMIGQIFLLSTLDAHEAAPDLRLVDIKAFLADSIEELRLAIPAEEAVFEESGLEGQSLYIRADPFQLRRVVENLVDNSRRHGGRKPICIRIGLRTETTEGTVPQKINIHVVFEDNGRGIAEENLERVFDRFWRGDKTRPGGGFGLGLAIARRIVESQGGSIRAEKPESGGTRIVLSLPEAEFSEEANA